MLKFLHAKINTFIGFATTLTTIYIYICIYISTFRIMYTTFFDSGAILGSFPSMHFFNVLLTLLFILHIYWFSLIVALVYNVLTKKDVSYIYQLVNRLALLCPLFVLGPWSFLGLFCEAFGISNRKSQRSLKEALKLILCVMEGITHKRTNAVLCPEHSAKIEILSLHLVMSKYK